jgi:hypothetical protein
MGDKPSKEKEKTSQLFYSKSPLNKSPFERKVSINPKESPIEELKFFIVLENIKCKNLTQVRNPFFFNIEVFF